MDDLRQLQEQQRSISGSLRSPEELKNDNVSSFDTRWNEKLMFKKEPKN